MSSEDNSVLEIYDEWAYVYYCLIRTLLIQVWLWMEKKAKKKSIFFKNALLFVKRRY